MNKNTKKVQKYLLTDVTSFLLNFSDGTTSRIEMSNRSDMVLVKVFSHPKLTASFEQGVQENYLKSKNASQLAELCGYDCQRTFSRHFKRIYGQSPYQWMLDRKMEEIQELVFNTDLPISEIAQMYDFKDLSHLVSSYTRKYGMSPLKNRNLKSQNSQKVK